MLTGSWQLPLLADGHTSGNCLPQEGETSSSPLRLRRGANGQGQNVCANCQRDQGARLSAAQIGSFDPMDGLMQAEEVDKAKTDSPAQIEAAREAGARTWFGDEMDAPCKSALNPKRDPVAKRRFL